LSPYTVHTWTVAFDCDEPGNVHRCTARGAATSWVQVCSELVRQPMVTPCGHIACLDCTATARERCPLPSCRTPYKMQVRRARVPRPSGKLAAYASWGFGCQLVGDRVGRKRHLVVQVSPVINAFPADSDTAGVPASPPHSSPLPKPFLFVLVTMRSFQSPCLSSLLSLGRLNPS
jgi:hypothetical protein